MTNSKDALSGLWSLTGLPAQALDAVNLTGDEPGLPSSFRIGTAAQASIAASALAARDASSAKAAKMEAVAETQLEQYITRMDSMRER